MRSGSRLTCLMVEAARVNDLAAADLSAPEDRARRGREVRKRLPRADLAAWAPAADRPDPVQLLLGEETHRVAELLPLRDLTS